VSGLGRRCLLKVVIQNIFYASLKSGRDYRPRCKQGWVNDARPAIHGLRPVHTADSSFLFDDIDFVLPSRCAEKRAAILRQVTYLFPSEADRLNDEQIERLTPRPAVRAGHEKRKSDFTKYSKPNAQRLLRYWRIREASAGSA
jgi:hypothetical protein